MNLLLSANQLGSLTRTERNDYIQEVSDEIADRIKEERALLDMEDNFIGYDFSKDYDFDDDMGIFSDRGSTAADRFLLEDGCCFSDYDYDDHYNYGPLSEV